jgi:hypothetical protein
MDMSLQQKVTAFGFLFDKALHAEIQRLNVSPALVPAALPCNLLCFLDQRLLHFVLTPSQGTPTQVFMDRRLETALTPTQAVDAAIRELGYVNPSGISFDAKLLEMSGATQLSSVEKTARQLVARCIRLATRPKAIPGYEGLQSLIDTFSADHPEFDKNVFIAMRFRPGKQFLEIHAAVKSGLARYGLKGLRSDDKVYPQDSDLWTNICVYMMGCKYGVCVFEEIDEREFNPNVPLEYGFMRAMSRHVLLLKDIRMPKMPTDMTGKLYRNFDTYNITATIHEQISQWAERDLGLKLV